MAPVLVTLTFLPPALLAVDRFTLPKEVALHSVALVVGVALLRECDRRSDEWVDGVVWLFAALGVAAVLWVPNPYRAFRFASITASAATLFIAARRASREQRSALVVGVSAAGMLIAASVLLEAYGMLPRMSVFNRSPGGTMGNRNQAAHLLALTLPLAWHLSVRSRGKRGRLLAHLIVAVLAAAIVVTRSRAAWLAGLGTLLLLVWTTGISGAPATLRRSRLNFALAALAGVLVALLVPNRLEWRSSYADTLARLLDGATGSGHGRLVQYTATLRMAADHPLLGVGPGGWPAAYARYAVPGDPSYRSESYLTPVDAYAQSDWLGLSAERGFVAMLGLTAAAAGLIARALHARSGRPGNNAVIRRTNVHSLLMLLSAALILGSLDAVLILPAGACVVAVGLGTLVPACPLTAARQFDQTARRVMIGLLVCASLFGAVYGVRGIRARQWSGNWRQAPGRPERLEHSARLDPGTPELHLLLARSWIALGRCEGAVAPLRTLERVWPALPAAEELRAICRDGRVN